MTQSQSGFTTQDAPQPTHPVHAGGHTLMRAVHAEWLRMSTVRGSWWFAAAMVLVMTGMSTLLALDARDGGVGPNSTAWDGAAFTVLPGLFILTAWAAVTAASDHATGAIVATLQWTPRRGVLATGRVLTIAAVTTAAGLALVISAALIIRVIAGISLDGPTQLGEHALIFGCGALIGVGLALATRSTAASLVGALALLIVLPLLLSNLPFEWALTIVERLPGSSVILLISGEGPPGLTVGEARLTLVAWAIVCVAAGVLRLRRDP